MSKGNETVKGETQEQTIARLLAENAALKAKATGERSLTLKVSEKGAVSVYGLGRFPVTLYGEQWPRLIEFAPKIQAFIDANRDKLSTKAQAQARKAAESKPAAS